MKMRDPERNQDNYITILFLIFLCWIQNFCVSQTIDNKLYSLELSTDLEQSVGMKLFKPNDTTKIVLIEQCFIQKRNNEFVKDLSGRTTGVHAFPDTCAYFSEGTKAILVGLADNSKIRKGTIKKCVSFRINSMPEIGDTAKFEFLFLSFNKKKGLSPTIYFSEKFFVSKKMKILNFRKFIKIDHYEKSGTTDKIQLCTISLPVSNETKNHQWIHLVFDFKRADTGLILPLDLSIIDNKKETIQDTLEKPFYNQTYELIFDFDSNVLDTYNVKILDSIIEIWKTNSNISFKIQGMSDKTGNLDYNLKLANSRALKVLNYLTSNGIPRERIELLIPAIVYDGPEINNRKCSIQILK